MEVSGKELQHILYSFIKFCDYSANCELSLEEFMGKEREIINDFIESNYPGLWNEKMKNS